MGFDTSMTTKLKSVGDAVQIIALLIGGVIILNVPNCESFVSRPHYATYLQIMQHTS